MKTIIVTIHCEARPNIKSPEKEIFDKIVEEFETIERVREFLKERYGKIPNGKRKIYIDDENGKRKVIGFLHSFWNKDYSHVGESWFQTDWIQFKEIEYKDFEINKIWENKKFTPISWGNAEEGQEVFLKGTSSGKIKFYGPHKIYDKQRRELINKDGINFLHYPEELYIKEDGNGSNRID